MITVLVAGMAAVVGAALLAAPGFAAASATQRWSTQHSPNAVVANGMLAADACTSPDWCVAVGSSATRRGSAPLTEVWNGTSWRVVPAPVPAGATHGGLAAVSCAASTACVAVGHDTNTAGNQVALAESWNGTSWTIQPVPDPVHARRSVLDAVACASATFCVAGGTSSGGAQIGRVLAETWNGTTWTLRRAVPPDSSDSILYGAFCGAVTSCVAVGEYLDSHSDLWVTLAESWNGVAWSVQPTPNPDGAILSRLDAVSCTSATACTATGSLTNGNGIGSGLVNPLAEVWNGTTWAIQPTPYPAGANIASLSGVSCLSPDACEAAGYWIPTVGHGRRPLAEVWNGATWTLQVVPGSGQANDSLSGVSCLTPAACFAVGRYREPSGTPVALAEQWNGSTWAATPSPSPRGAVPSILDGVSCPAPSACVAVGFYDNTSYTHRTLAESWNGSTWTVQPTADPPHLINNLLYGVSCSAAAACTAVGYSYNHRADTFSLAERWNGTTWTRQHVPGPPGTHTSLDAVSCPTDTDCTAVGATSSGLLAEQWNGTTWTPQTMPLPSGYDFVLNGVSCSSATACTAVGSYTSSAQLVGLTERWNGTTWAVQATPAKVSALYSVSCASATTCTAVGEHYSYPAGISPLAEQWTSDRWQVQPVPVPTGSGFSSLYGVSCRTVRDCVAVGGYRNDALVTVPLAVAWNGTAWTVQATEGDGRLNSVLAAVSYRSPSGYTGAGSRADRARGSLTLVEASSGTPQSPA